MYGRGLHIAVALMVVTLTILTPDGAFTASAVPGLLGAQAGALDAAEAEGHVATETEARGAAAAGEPGNAGMVTVTVTVLDPRTPPVVLPVTPPAPALVPVYRFYSPSSGTHFYTPSAEERDMVIARWSNVWLYEGIAYSVNAASNAQPLYRFYNRANGSHFYTASATERDAVFARWMNVFQYDGETYAVTSSAQAGAIPVYRFYNVKNGSHFYTASLEEANHVITTWPDVYRLEGSAFWLGQ